MLLKIRKAEFCPDFLGGWGQYLCGAQTTLSLAHLPMHQPFYDIHINHSLESNQQMEFPFVGLWLATGYLF